MSAEVREILCALIQNESICARPPRGTELDQLVSTAIALNDRIDAALTPGQVEDAPTVAVTLDTGETVDAVAQQVADQTGETGDEPTGQPDATGEPEGDDNTPE